MIYKFSKEFCWFGIIATIPTLTFCTKHTSKTHASGEKNLSAAEIKVAKDFKLTCLGETSKCGKTEISVTNISKKTYSDLIIICTHKDDPNESERDPHHNWPFSLDPGETKCMEAASECYNKVHKGKGLGNYYTLIQLDSDNNPVWKLGNDCMPKK